MFEKVAIIGIGLLGGSLARDLKKHGIANHVVGVCKSQTTARAAIADQVVDDVLSLEDAVKNANLIVLATPMQSMVPLLQSLHNKIPENSIITDVGSVKTDLYARLKLELPSVLNKFVLAHPIAGGENSGVAASKLGLFENKHVIITDTDEVSGAAASLVADMWTTLGAKVMRMSLQEHDAVFAKTSHLPHVIAFSLVNFLSHQGDRKRLFDLAAAGFYDFTRIASSDAEMWRDICITNRQEILTALDGFRDQIDVIRNDVANSDQTAILNYFAEAKIARDAGLLNKAESMKKIEQ